MSTFTQTALVADDEELLLFGIKSSLKFLMPTLRVLTATNGKEAIELLPDGQRTVVALRHYEGFSLKEIAEVRGCALGTVKSTLHQAFRSLRKSLGAELLENVAHDHPEILPYPAPYGLFTAFGDSSLDFELRAWTESEDAQTTVRSDMAVAIQEALAEAGIEVPFPQHDLYLKQVPTRPGENPS